MHSRQSHAVRLWAKSYAPAPLLLLACLCFAPAANRARAAAPEKEKHVNRQVVKYVAHKEKVPYQGKLVMVLAVEPLSGSGRQMELIVKNKDMNKREYDPVINTDNVNALTKGEAIKIELDESRPKPMVTYLKKYDLKPGESDPKAYRFLSSYKKGEGAQAYTAVVLGKFDESTTVAVPTKKAKEGQAEPAADIETLLAELKPEELVEAEVRESRPVPVLVNLERYATPQTGKFVKLSEEDVAEGQKGSAVEIEQDGKTVKAWCPESSSTRSGSATPRSWAQPASSRPRRRSSTAPARTATSSG